MNSEIAEVLRKKQRVLWGLARKGAFALGAREAGSFADDLALEALTDFVKEERDGWFHQEVEGSLEQRVIHLFQLCLRRAKRKLGPRLDRSEFSNAAEAERREHETAALESATVAPDVQIDDEQSRVAMRRAALAIKAPMRRLVLLATDLPDLVTLDHIAAAHHSNPSAVIRGPAETWTSFQALRDHRNASDESSTEWRLTLVELFRFRGPLGTTPLEIVKKELNSAIERPRSNALQDLKKVMVAAEEELR